MESLSALYYRYWTDAPTAYDGFGTVTVDNHERYREVLVQAEHAKWQVARYMSGMYAVTPSEAADQVQYQVFGAPANTEEA